MTHSANTTESGFEMGCTWSDIHEMSTIHKIQTENLRVKNLNSLDKIQHYDSHVYISRGTSQHALGCRDMQI